MTIRTAHHTTVHCIHTQTITSCQHHITQPLCAALNGEVRLSQVTNFVNEHPGGAGVILESAGQDCTEEFIEGQTQHLGAVTLTGAAPIFVELARFHVVMCRTV